MPNVQWNTFIDKHKIRFCVTIGFADYADLRKRVKGPIMTRDGKEFPTPNAVTKGIAKAIKSDYTIKSSPLAQIVMISDETQSKEFAKAVGAKKWDRGDGKPCSAKAIARVSHEQMTALAKRLRLL